VGDGVSAGAQAESRKKTTIRVLRNFDFTISSYLCVFSQIFYSFHPVTDSDGNNMYVFDLLIGKYYLS
jgi:hypothetical protein